MANTTGHSFNVLGSSPIRQQALGIMSYASLTKEWKEKAAAIAREAHGGEVLQFDLGRKVSVPQDVMMEELSLQSNKGSKMFQMRQKRVDKFMVEGVGGVPNINSAEHLDQGHMNAGGQVTDGMKENYRTEAQILHRGKGPGPAVAPKPFAKLSAAKNIKVVLNPNIIAPGYSGPLKEIPPEKFNVTAIPRSYQSPWAEALSDQVDLLETVFDELPEAPKPESQTYRCFNRAATPFGAPVACRRMLEVHSYEPVEIPEESVTVDTPRFTNRPSFNRMARGWTGPPLPESAEL
ncbi:myozenin-2-like isoform X2 [Narcine bancroftii]|uniref:myozenin-2-like isoform X2 n=1 Tax=Narcine bancroftii TaxID=1343680 RepID=UPI0038317255